MPVQRGAVVMRTAAAGVLAVAVAAASTGAAQMPEVRWVRVPAGSFEMGCVSADTGCSEDERPRHRVTLTRPFELLITEVTAGMFQVYAAANGSPMPQQPPWNRESHAPVVNVSWNEADAFCRSLAARLPTEAEWEYAARAGRPGAIYAWEGPVPVIDGRPAANVADEAAKTQNHDWMVFEGYADGYPYTAPVASFPTNRYGVHDMSGNVWEWVADWFEAGYYRESPASDPPGPSSGPGRVVRGGSWADYSRGLRLSYRSLASPTARGIDLGFRCARDVPP
ncbi:MAG: SUMF1/EgtB/PvdO family nonheme iron enzyme [Acidobacteria bacterium]|nr:SUMF1/EgtB/PvdO family nonheme iron enzyme [Acidobacteriota bacterium]